MGRSSKTFKESTSTTPRYTDIDLPKGELVGKLSQEDLDAALANGEMRGESRQTSITNLGKVEDYPHTATHFNEVDAPKYNKAYSKTTKETTGTFKMSPSGVVQLTEQGKPDWELAGFSSAEEHAKELHELYTESLSKEQSERKDTLDKMNADLQTRTAEKSRLQTEQFVPRAIDPDLVEGAKVLHERLRAKEAKALKERAEQTKADAAARKANAAARLSDSTTEAAETPEQREAKRMEHIRGGRGLSEQPLSKEAIAGNERMQKLITSTAKSGGFLKEANEQEFLEEPAWKRAGFSSAEEHATELEKLYRNAYPTMSTKDRLLDISNQGRRWPTQLDPTSIDVPTPTASEDTVRLNQETGGSDKAVKPATSSPEEALSIARRQGGTGTARQRAHGETREGLKAERDAYAASRKEELLKEHKNPDGTWKDTADAHEEETTNTIKDYDRRIRLISSTKAKAKDKAVTEEQQERTKTGNTEAALRGLADDFKIAHESGDVIGRERARAAYHNVAELEGYVADIDTPCTTANCGNIIKGESQIPTTLIKPVPGRTLGVSKGEPEFTTTEQVGGDEEGTVCKDCAAKGL